jgi:glycosyltransferase involved in cell wall biosynthesis
MDKRPQKVLHIVEDLKIGGLEKVIAAIVLHLDKNKYDVQVFCLVKGGAIADELITEGINVKILNLNSYYDPFQVISLAQLIRREAFHVIHSHGYFASTFVRLAAFMIRTPVMVTHIHSAYIQFKKRNFMIDRFLARFTDKIICVSRAVQRFVIKIEGIEKQKTCVIYNGADIPLIVEKEGEIRRRRQQWGIEQYDIVITIVASLTENKGHKILLEAFNKVSQFLPSLKLLIVGDGFLKEDLKSRSLKFNIEKNVIFTGEQDHVQELLQISDLFVLSSLFREGLSIALIEAIATGLPVVATNVGGNPEIIEDGANGFLVPPGNADRLAHAIKTLVSNPDLRKRMGAQGRKIYEGKFKLSLMIQQIESLYDLLLGEKGAVSKA